MAAALGLVAGVCALVASAFHAGRLDAVRGTRTAAQLLRSGHVVRDGVALHMVLMSNLDDASMNGDQRRVSFFSGGRPWVCPRSTFACPAAEK